jgi:hypothetical protein
MYFGKREKLSTDGRKGNVQFEVTEFYCIFYLCFLSSRILWQINNLKLFPRNEAVINLNAATLTC